MLAAQYNNGPIAPMDPVDLSLNYLEFLQLNNINNRYHGILLFVLNLTVLDIVKNERGPNFDVPDAPLGATPVVIAERELLVASVQVDSTLIEESRAKGNGYMLTMAAAYQTKPITIENIKGFFTSQGILTSDNSFILKLVRFFASMVPRIMDNVFLRGQVIGGLWSEYHTAHSSGQILIPRFLEALPPQFTSLVSANDRALVTAAAANRWDQASQDAIPVRIVAMTQIFITASKGEVGDWWQGKRALTQISIMDHVTFKNLFKKMLELNSDLTKIEAARSMAELALAAPASIHSINVAQAVVDEAIDARIARGQIILERMNFEERRRFLLDPMRTVPHIFVIADVDPASY